MKQWRCTVCGYIYKGENPPITCPVCGVGPDDFVLENPVMQPATVKATKRWKCTVCDYIHVGDEAPEICPLCGVGKELFVMLSSDEATTLTAGAVRTADKGTANAALDTISYGLYIISSISAAGDRINGQTANSVIQLTSQPPQIAVCLNKRNLTHEYITATNVLAVSILAQSQIEPVKRFGYQSGRTTDKFAGVDYILGNNGCPILKDCIAYLEAAVIPEKMVDVGTHTIFVAQITSGKMMDNRTPLTYAHYRSVK